MKIKSEKDVKALVDNPDNIAVMKSLFEAIAFQETVRSVIAPKQQEIIDFYKFKIDEKWKERGDAEEIIISEKRMFLASDDDFQIYLKELEQFYYSDACPFKPKRKGNCPLLEAESFVRDIKREVAEFFKEDFGFGYDAISGSLTRYKQYYDLLLTMFASNVKSKIAA